MEKADYLSVFQQACAGTAFPAEDALLLPDWSAENWEKLLQCTVPQPFHANEVVLKRATTTAPCFSSLPATWKSVLPDRWRQPHSSGAHQRRSIVGEQSFFDGHSRSAKSGQSAAAKCCASISRNSRNSVWPSRH